MSGSDEGGYSLWTVIKVVLIVLGAVYVMSLVTWFAQWAIVLLAVGGVGYLGYRVSRAALPSEKKPPKRLTSESPYDKRLRELEDEERLLDHKIGL